MGVVRHADAGYPEAIDAAERGSACTIPVRVSDLDRGAAQVLRPPEDGRRTCATRRRAAAAPGSVTLRGGVIVALDDDPGADVVIDATGGAVIPGFVDCHTHLPFAGWRAEEYELKVTGVPYEEIARAGVGSARRRGRWRRRATRRCSPRRARSGAEMLAHGTTTFESQVRLRAVARGRAAARCARPAARAPDRRRPRCSRTPSPTGRCRRVDGRGRRGCPAAAAVGALDIYVESVAFSNEDLARMGELAGATGSPRAHVEQFNANRSVPVALEAGARSVDHLACLHPDDVAPLAAAECAAVLLPGAEFLGAEETAPGRALADAGAICVLATDCNPAPRRSSRSRW